MIRCYNCFGVMNPDGDVLRCSRCGAVMDAVEDKAATVIAPQLGPSIDLRPVAIVLSLIIAAAVVGAGAYFLPEVFSPDAAEDGDPSLLGGSATEITSRPPPGGDSAVDLAQGRWTRVLGTVGGDRLMAMDLTGTGDVIVAARSTGELAPGGANAALLRLDARGELLLQADLPAFADARSLAIVAAPNEDVLVAGHVGDELVMERVGPAGVQRWRRRVASVADHRTGVAAALSGTDLVVAGPGRNASSARVLRMDADGYAEWQREFAIDVKAPFAGVAPASGEDVLVALTDAGDGAPYVRRLDSTGQVAWRRAISVTGGGELAGFIPTASEGAALVMEGFAPELALVDGDGGTVWVTALPPPASAAPLILARAGERLFVGASYRLSGVSEDMWLARYDRAGAMVWDDYPRVAGDDRLQALTASPAGDLFAAGTIRDDEFSISDVFVRMAFNAAVAALSDPAAASESAMEPPVVPPLRGTGAQARGADGETAPVAGDPSDVDESGAPAIEIAEAGVGGEVEDGVSSPASVDAAGEEAPTASSPRAVAAPAPIADAADIAPDDDRGERDVREPVSSAGEPVPETPPQEVAAAPAPAPAAPSAPADPPISADVSSRAPVEAPVASVEPAEPPRAAAGRERPRSGALSTAFNCSFACQSRADPGVTFPLEQFFVDQPPADERTFAQSIQSDMINACAAVGGVGDAATMPVCARAQTYTCVLDCVSDADPEVRFPLNQTYVDPSPLSPERFADRVKDEMMALCAVAGGVASPADVPICESDR